MTTKQTLAGQHDRFEFVKRTIQEFSDLRLTRKNHLTIQVAIQVAIQTNLTKQLMARYEPVALNAFAIGPGIIYIYCM